MINGHGNDLHNFKDEIKADFSSNVWFEGPHPSLLKHISEQTNKISNYPEPDAASCAKEVEQLYKLNQNSCIVTNGSVEGFYLLAQALNKRTATIFAPTFSEYEDACHRYNYKLEIVSNHDINPNTKFDSDLIWLCNPNNPDGRITSISIIEKWLYNNTQSLFIIDEAYAELCIGFESALPLINKHRNLIIVKSFTKAFSIPGLRLGVILANPKLIMQIKPFQLPWSVNSLAIEACSYIIKNYNTLLFNLNLLESISNDLQKQINSIPELEVTPSACNYFIVKTKKSKVSELKSILANEHGLLIRDASNFHGLSKQHFRIAIQSPDKNTLLISALKQWSNS